MRSWLGKDPEERWQSGSDIKSELLWISQSSGEAAIRQPTMRGKAWRAYAVFSAAAALLVAIAVVSTYLLSHRASNGAVVRAVVVPPPNVTPLPPGDQARAPAISPDG